MKIMKTFKVKLRGPNIKEIKADFYFIEHGFVHFTIKRERTGDKVASIAGHLVESIEA